MVAYILKCNFCAHTNHTNSSGHKSTGFCAIWMMLLLLGFGILGSKIMFSGKSTNLFTGIMLGSGLMLVQLNFAFSIFFLKMESHKEYDYFGNQTNKNEIDDVNQGNNAMGAFAIINTIVFAVWTALLYYKKGELYVDNLQQAPEGHEQISENDNDYNGKCSLVLD